MRVLLADKDPYDLEMMRSELEGPEIEVLTARDGRELLDVVREHSPDVIVASSSLGQMGGLAVARELKMLADIPGNPPAPAIAILIERPADAWLAAWSRCDAWRTRPVHPEDLRSLVKELVSQAGAADAKS